MIFGFLCYYNYKLFDSPGYYHAIPTKIKIYNTTTKYYQPELRNYTDYTFKDQSSYKCFVDKKAFKPMPLSEINHNIRDEYMSNCEFFTSKKFKSVQICFFKNITIETLDNTTIKADFLQDRNLLPRTTQTGIAYAHKNDVTVYFDCAIDAKRLVYVGINPITVIYQNPLACRAGAKRMKNVIRCTNTKLLNTSLENSTKSENNSLPQQLNETNATTASNMTETNDSPTNSANNSANQNIDTNTPNNETNATISIVSDETLTSTITSTQQSTESNNNTNQELNETNDKIQQESKESDVSTSNKETNSEISSEL